MSNKNFQNSSKKEYIPCIEGTSFSFSPACFLNERCIPFNTKKEENNMSTTTVKGNGKAATEKAATEKAATEKAANNNILLHYSDIHSNLPAGNYSLENFLNFTSKTSPILGRSTQRFNRYLFEDVILHNTGKENNLLVTVDRQKHEQNSYRVHTEITEEIRAEFTGGDRKDPVEVWKKKMITTYNSLLNSYNESHRLKTIKGQDLDDMFKVIKRFYNIALRAGAPVDYPVQIKTK